MAQEFSSRISRIVQTVFSLTYNDSPLGFAFRLVHTFVCHKTNDIVLYRQFSQQYILRTNSYESLVCRSCPDSHYTECTYLASNLRLCKI